MSGARQTPSSLLAATLAAIRASRDGAASRGVRLVGVTGSVARLQAGPESDIDVVYEVAGRPTLFDVGDIQMDLQDAIGRTVDMIDLEKVKPGLRTEMERDLVRA
jgi:predicted nucleotidyltransferase